MLHRAASASPAASLGHRCCRRYLASSAARDSQRRALRRRNQQTLEKEFGGMRRPANAKSQRKSSNSSSGPPPPPPQSSSFFTNPLVWYSTKLETHPFATKCITSGLIAASGDLLCQYLVHRNHLAAREELVEGEKGSRPEREDQAKQQRPDEIIEIEPRNFEPDWYRTGRFGILGFFLVAPVVHLWYARLTKFVPGTNVGAVIKRTAVDQLCFAPLFLPTFMMNLMMLEGRPYAEAFPKLQKDLPGALVTNWCLWVPAMLVNFRFVPLKYQVLYSNMVGFVWNTYLSWKTQEEGEGDEGEGGRDAIDAPIKAKEIVAESHM